MRVLLDTHAFLWFATGDPRLSSTALEIIQDRRCQKFVSVASCWEISIKQSLGRLNFAIPLGQLLSNEIEGNGFKFLGIQRRHLLAISALPPVHGDPFDRLLVCQAKVEQLTLLSKDDTLDGYKIERVW